MPRPPPRSTLFPYTTLFRSSRTPGTTRIPCPPSCAHARRCRSARTHSSRCTGRGQRGRSEEHTSELQSRVDLVCRLLLEKKKKKKMRNRQRIERRTQQATSN